MQIHNYPFEFTTQASVNLADDDELMSLMIDCGITSSFIGIETPDEISSQDCNKVQNKNRDMIQSVIKIQKAGIQVSAGFIVGFDSDSSSVFQRQIDFIQESGIDLAISTASKFTENNSYKDIPSTLNEICNYFDYADYFIFFMRFVKSFEEAVGLKKYQHHAIGR